ncbi:MAG TPA: cupredoxin domain-containing protein [Solirubrobacteraceae bacterium]|nr:cupredoxin domain-containing protein [Solirubrobacteraceae bacterium]
MAALAGLLAAGCEPSAVPVGGRTVRIEASEYRLRPQNVTVRAGRVTFVVVNRGRLIHNLAVERIASDPDTTPPTLGRSSSLHPGQTSKPFTIDLPPGKYRLVCTIGNHDDLGEHGWLYVTKD